MCSTSELPTPFNLLFVFAQGGPIFTAEQVWKLIWSVSFPHVKSYNAEDGDQLFPPPVKGTELQLQQRGLGLVARRNFLRVADYLPGELQDDCLVSEMVYVRARVTALESSESLSLAKTVLGL